jgi:predicted nucleotidyltransferase
MHPILEEKREQLERLCARYGVKRLEVFGSVTTHRFDPVSSDLDFLVDMEIAPRATLADRYFGLLEDLEALFGRHVDLVMTGAIRNPYFLEAIERSRTLLYAA